MPLPPLGDTIAAIATAPGAGAIGIVRISGADTYRVADAVFRARSGRRLDEIPAGRVVYGSVVAGEEQIDECLLLTFRRPHSYTGEDVVELQTHGGPAVLRRTLELLHEHGARLAGPGEFTLRAYLNDRLDLTQAEAVLELVNAQSEAARRNAALGLSRELARRLGEIQTEITRVYGNLQAVFDYPEEGVPESEFREPLARAVTAMDDLLATARAGRLARHGARLALIGRPNAGKSSLLNALLGYGRSIVSDVPGTTRDYLEAPLEIDGMPVTAVDTAGIRETSDLVEASGVRSAREIAAASDVALLLLDATVAPTGDERTLTEGLEERRTIFVASKVDAGWVWSPDDLPDAPEVLPVSSHTGEGLEALRGRIRAVLVGDAGGAELWITNERHASALREAREFVVRAMDAPDDLAALDLEEALRALAGITGRGEIAEETLAHIFAQFCVGK